MKSLKIGFGLLVAVLIFLFAPLPYYITYPGEATSIEQFMTVEDGDKEPGELMMVTISQRRATPLWLVGSWFTPFTEASPSSRYLYDGEGEADYERRQQLLMSSSQQAAVQYAYDLAEAEVSVSFDGMYVSAPIQGSLAANVLKPGDVITAIDGRSFVSRLDFLDRVAAYEAGDEVTLTLERDGRERVVHSLVQPLDRSQSRVGLGIYEPLPVQDVVTEPSVTFELTNVGGPSAGLMFTLELFDQLTPGDLANGEKIAGTGTVDEEGNIGPIGGAWQKIVAADRAGATVFFVPDGPNYEEAKTSLDRLESDIEVVPVKTVEDAIRYLESMN
ncbi:SepM family pheromone-processing serine protease [Exiguobacterium aurantiacum]|uniref:endopeptidase La n=1 Tax=Exiguobacterium aurantiacum TaxID=33987 RepID=A0A377FUS8_9BACL|nr:SepM family pheromone-processing serine protease [Exiguobacterium aurantiacum]STO08559.1 DNA-binding ATP-dependent protease La [Exiguobacterium aurantiacum]